MSTPTDEVERLLNSGVELPDDPAELALLLEGQEPASESMGGGPINPDPDLGDPKQTTETPDDPKETPEEPKETPEHKPEEKPAEPAPEEPDPKAIETPPEGPPPAVLRETRQRLHTAREERDQERSAREKMERENADLRAKLETSEAQLKTGQTRLQDAADTVVADANVDLEVDSEAAIRAKLGENYDEDILGVVLDLSRQSAALAKELREVKSIADTQAQREESAARDQFEEALNQNPLVALLRDDESSRGNDLWSRAVSYDKALQADPDWADKSMVERFGEVDRRMRGYLGEEGVKTLLGEEAPKPTEQPKADPKPADPVPSSLSDLPSTGRPTSQTEAEQLEAMSATDIEARIDKVIEAGGDVDQYLSRLMSSVSDT